MSQSKDGNIVGTMVRILAGIALLSGLYQTGIFFWSGEPWNPLEPVLGPLVAWGLYCLVMPVLAWMVRNFPLRTITTFRSLAAHSFVCLFVSAFHLWLQNLILQQAGLEDPWFGISFFLLRLSHRIFLYVLFILFLHALESHRLYRNRQFENAKLKARIATEQLRAMRNCSPDLIFRMLDSAGQKIHEDVESADSLIARLGDYLRTVVRTSGQPLVPVEIELEMLEAWAGMIEEESGVRIRISMPKTRERFLVPRGVTVALLEKAILPKCGSSEPVNVTVSTGASSITIEAGVAVHLQEVQSALRQFTAEELALDLHAWEAGNMTLCFPRDNEEREPEQSQPEMGALKEFRISRPEALLLWIILVVVLTSPGLMIAGNSYQSIPWDRSFIGAARIMLLGLMCPLYLATYRRFPVLRPWNLRNLMINLLIVFGSSALSHQLLAMVASAMGTSELSLPLPGIPDLLIVATVLGLRETASSQDRAYDEMLRRQALIRELTLAKVEGLRMQLHPHFLFNALHSISQLVRENRDQAQAMLLRLKEFLRITLVEEADVLVPLRKELNFLDHYLSIQQIRFQHRLHVKIDTDAESEASLIPPLILQPIVENAVRHGLGKSGMGGQIRIAASRQNGILEVCVSDSGPGLGRKPGESGMGLQNTATRLRQLYGHSQHLFMKNREEGGVEVVLRIPQEAVL